MSADWQKVKIADVCALIVDCVNKTAPKVDHKTPFKMIRTPNIKNGRVDLSDCNFVDEDTYEKWTRRAKVLYGDVLLTREAPMGEVGFVDFHDTVFLGQRIMQYRADSEKLDPEYLLYAFLSPNLQNQFSMHEGSGSVVSHIRVPDCSKFELLLPPLDKQREIAKILRDLDKKIHLNTQTNQILESIAQTIFKSWFVDFEPVKAKMAVLAEGGTREQAELAAMSAISGKNEIEIAQMQKENFEYYSQLAETAALFPSAMVESELGETNSSGTNLHSQSEPEGGGSRMSRMIPEGWEVKNIENILELAYGKSLGKTERIDGNIPVYGSGGLTGWHNKYLVNGPGIIVGRKGTVGSIYWEKNNFFPIDTVFYVTPKNGIPLIYTYYLLQILGLENMNTDAAVPGLNRNNAYRLETIFSSIELINAFSKIANSLKNEFDLLLEQSNHLSKLRDSLLPKLLSGEIDLSEIHSEVA